MPQSQKSEFALFIDESGSPKPNLKDSVRHFALGGVFLARENEHIIELKILEFKQRWDLDPATALHGAEIRSKKKNFAWLGKCQETRNKFLADLDNTITSMPILIHACVISRTGYLDRYADKYGTETWEMMKSAFTILIERSAKYAGKHNGSIMVYYEKVGKKEDRLIKGYFNDLRISGHPFNPLTASKYQPLDGNKLSDCLRGIEGKKKNNPILQVADLCLYPVARAIDKPGDRAYLSLKKKNILVDSQLEIEEIESVGIKYYCFDR